ALRCARVHCLMSSQLRLHRVWPPWCRCIHVRLTETGCRLLQKVRLGTWQHHSCLVRKAPTVRSGLTTTVPACFSLAERRQPLRTMTVGCKSKRVFDEDPR